MAYPLPPQHRVDATPTYVDIEDTAWDQDRINAERAEVDKINAARRAKAEELAEESGEYVEPELIKWAEHPVVVYLSATTRYDLDAPLWWRGQQCLASDWLGPDSTRFVLRRLEWEDYYRVRSALLRDVTQGYVLACRLGLVRIEGSTKIRVDEDAAERSHDEMRRLFDANPELILRVGKAVWEASQPLTEQEKKASDGSRGRRNPPASTEP